MSGDYTRFTFEAAKRFSGVLMQQGRVQLDSDWNEGIDIFKERVRKLSLDLFGPVGIPTLVSPDAFLIGVIAGPPLDLSIGVGRLYADGWMAENFLEAPPVTYLTQPFLPDPPPLPTGNGLAFLDLWEREVTYIEDPDLLDVALGGVDTATRIQQVWQLRFASTDAAAECGIDLDAMFPPSAGRLSTEAIAPPAPDDPCVLPPIAGYRGLENRLYRLEIHEGGSLGTARFRWSQAAGSIVSAVTGIAVSGTTTRLTVNRIGRDRMLRFRINDWASITDDYRELRGEPVDMARIVDIDEAAKQIVVDRPLAAFPTSPADLAARHTRIQRWDQRAPMNTLDGDGLMTTAAGPIDLEDGIRVRFDVEPANGVFRTGDYWLFAARTATAWVEPLVTAPPRGIRHTYVQLAAINGLGSTNVVTDCRPKTQADCCCITLRPGEGEYIQDAINALPEEGGCICLLPGLHRPSKTIVIPRSNITLKAESGGAVVRLEGEAPVLIIGNERAPITDILVSRITFERVIGDTPPAIIIARGASNSVIEHCAISNLRSAGSPGIVLSECSTFRVEHCHLRQVFWGIVAAGRTSANLLFRRNRIELERANRDERGVGILMVDIDGGGRAEGNLISGPASGIVVAGGSAQMMTVSVSAAATATDFVSVTDNFILCTPGARGNDSPMPCFGIDLASDYSSASENNVIMFVARQAEAAAIRLSGNNQRAFANTLLGYGEAAGTVGISVGRPGGRTWDISAIDNRIAGCRTGIRASNASEVEISGNHISADTQRASATSGIVAEAVVSSEICGNDVRAVDSAIAANAGRANRFSGNELRGCATGIWLDGEILPVVAGNRVEEMRSFGIGIRSARLSCEVSGNHVDRCGFDQPVAFGLVAVGVTGEMAVKFNEVRDTGLDTSGASKSAVALGITGLLILTASVEGNFVTYTNLGLRPVAAEDRALLMMGMSEFVIGGRAFGFPVTITDNKFYGCGRSALVELRQASLPNVLLGFERVIFSNNYCFHVSGEPNDALATVSLRGRAATVMGNQIQASTRFWSFDFNGMPGPLIGNVMAGGVLQHADFPVPQNGFNMII